MPMIPPTLDERTDLVATEPDSAQRIAEQTFYPHRLAILEDRLVPQLRVRLRASRLSDGVTLGLIGYGVPVRIDCGRLETGYQVNIPITGTVSYVRADHVTAADPMHGAIFAPDDLSAIDQVSAECIQLGVRFSRRYLDDIVERLCWRPSRAPQYAHAYDLQDKARAAWVAQVSSILELLRELPESSHDAIGPQFARAIAVGFLFSADHDLREELEHESTATPSKVLRRAMRAIDDAPADPIDILALAEHCGVSVRTLQYEFSRRLGLTPSEYRRKVALAAAHRDLASADPGHETVAEIAARWGFFHQGRFAREHKERYGALPAEVLRN